MCLAVFWFCFVFCRFNFTPLYPAISMPKCWFSLLEQTPTDVRMSHLKSVLQCGERILSQDIKLAKNVHLITMLIDEIQKLLLLLRTAFQILKKKLL